MTSCLSRNRSLVLPGRCIQNCPFPKELQSLSRSVDIVCTSARLSRHHLPDSLLMPSFPWQEPGIVGSRCTSIPTGALVRNEGASGISRWGVRQPVRTRTEFLLSRQVLTSHSFSATFSGGVRSCIGWRFSWVYHLSPPPEILRTGFGAALSRSKRSL